MDYAKENGPKPTTWAQCGLVDNKNIVIEKNTESEKKILMPVNFI
jgi:hypothetical protein